MNRLSKLLGFALLAALFVLTLPAPSSAQIAVGVSIHIGPPALPVYVQPPCPVAGYMWAPGYWAYGPAGYYWVPGTWVPAPAVGLLWTPGYWGWGGGGYLWHAGYWGPHIGFYGGINYGFGYGGVGFVGGEWRGGVFAYNTAVMHVNTTVIHNTYINNTVINNTTVVNRVSYNGGSGGVVARPTQTEMIASHDQHVAATQMQTQHAQAASTNRALLASENHGNPAIAASQHAGDFHTNVTAARSNNLNNRPAMNNAAQRNDRPPSANAPRPSNTSTNNSRAPQNNGQNNNQNNNHPNNQQHPAQQQHESHPEPHESHPEPHHPAR
jgi:WXXGXW repeat (2 copies)